MTHHSACGKENGMADDVFVGVDVAHDMLDIVVSSAGLVWRYPNDPAGIDRLVDAVAAWRPALVAVKSSGGHEFDAICALQAAGLAVLVISPHQAREFELALGEPGGTDVLDAQRLATLGATLYRQPSGEQCAKPMGDLERMRMQALMQRHRQLFALLMAEYQLLAQSHPSVRKGVEQTIGFLKVQIAGVERCCATHLRSHRATLTDALSIARRAGRGRRAEGAYGRLWGRRVK
jgi:transposase